MEKYIVTGWSFERESDKDRSLSVSLNLQYTGLCKLSDSQIFDALVHQFVELKIDLNTENSENMVGFTSDDGITEINGGYEADRESKAATGESEDKSDPIGKINEDGIWHLKDVKTLTPAQLDIEDDDNIYHFVLQEVTKKSS